LVRKGQQSDEAESVAAVAGETVSRPKKSARNKPEDGQDSLLVKKAAQRRGTKLSPEQNAATSLDIANDDSETVEDDEVEIFQPSAAEELQCCRHATSDTDRANLDRKYGIRGMPIVLDVLIGKIVSRQTIALENIFFHTARVLAFQFGDKKFFINLERSPLENNSGQTSIILSCDNGTIQIFLESLNDLSAFAPELSKFSIDSYPAPVQDMLLNSLLSPLIDRLSVLLSAKISMRLSDVSQNPTGPKFSFSARIYDDNPYEGKKVGLLLSAKIAMDLPLAEEIGKFIHQIPTAIPHAFHLPFRCENRLAETTISREDLASLRLGDVILLEDMGAVEAKRTRLLGLNPYEFACIGDGNKLTIIGVGRVPA
jgi:hypothetical protein